MYTVCNLSVNGKTLPYKRTNYGSVLNTRKKLLQFANDGLKQECIRHGYYLHDKTLGEGAYAKVRLAQLTSSKFQTMKHLFSDQKERPMVAIKIIDKRVVPDDFLLRFLPRELDNHLSLPPHPHVIQMFEYFWTDNYVFVVLEYCANGDLLDYLNNKIGVKGKGLDEDFCAKLFKQICQGLHHIHNNRIVHRDLKCENILLTSDMKAKITDFGFACRVYDKHFLKTSCGSYVYSAPEVIKNRSYDGYKIDVWSAGIILFSMVNGKLPYSDSYLNRMDEDMRLQKLTFGSEVSDDCELCIRKILTYNPLLRPSAEEILKDAWITKVKSISLPTNRQWVASDKGIRGNLSAYVHAKDESHCEDCSAVVGDVNHHRRPKSTPTTTSNVNKSYRNDAERCTQKNRMLKQKLQKGVIRRPRREDDTSVDRSKLGLCLSLNLITPKAEDRKRSKTEQKASGKSISTSYLSKMRKYSQRYRLIETIKNAKTGMQLKTNQTNPNLRYNGHTRISELPVCGMKVQGGDQESGRLDTKEPTSTSRLNKKEPTCTKRKPAWTSTSENPQKSTGLKEAESRSDSFNDADQKMLMYMTLNEIKSKTKESNKTEKCFGVPSVSIECLDS